MKEREGVPASDEASPAPSSGVRFRVSSLASLGDRPWLVLGGGGLKGLAHIGAWRALAEAGIEVQGVIGTSIGALVGSFIAHGDSWEHMNDLAEALTKDDIVRLNRRAVLINGIKQPSVFRGDVMREYFAEILPAGGWDALRLPLQVNAVELERGRTVWFGPGARTDVSMVDAVYASAALPVLYPPAIIGGVAHVDGGTEHPLALEHAVTLGATGLIGIDVGSGEAARTDDILAQGMIGVHSRIFAIMTYRRRRQLVSEWNGPPLLFVRPRLEGFGTFDFQHVKHFVSEGYRAMKEALAGLPLE